MVNAELGTTWREKKKRERTKYLPTTIVQYVIKQDKFAWPFLLQGLVAFPSYFCLSFLQQVGHHPMLNVCSELRNSFAGLKKVLSGTQPTKLPQVKRDYNSVSLLSTCCRILCNSLTFMLSTGKDTFTAHYQLQPLLLTYLQRVSIHSVAQSGKSMCYRKQHLSSMSI